MKDTEGTGNRPEEGTAECTAEGTGECAAENGGKGAVERTMKCTAVVLAAGQGRRMGANAPKQFLKLMGRPLLYYSLHAFQSSPLVDSVIIVTGEDDIDYVREHIVEGYGFSKVVAVVKGGSERCFSVWNGLQAVCRHAAPAHGAGRLDGGSAECIVLIHDGARPFIDEGIIERAVEAVRIHHACAVGMPAKDTVKIADPDGFVAETPRRGLVWTIQTPQGFDFGLVFEAYKRFVESGDGDVTDDAMVVERYTDTAVKLVEGSYRNIKITTPEDLEAAEAFLKGAGGLPQ